MTLPSERQILELFRNNSQQQFSLKKLARHFDVPAEERPTLRRLIRDMVASGRLVRVRGSHYALPDRLHALVGVVKRHEDGYGFLVLDDPREAREDIYIPRPSMRGVMHGDRVLARLEPRPRRGERRSGRVIQVLEREQHEVVGRLETIGKAMVLLPAEPRLCPEVFIPPKARGAARPGHMAVAEITSYGLGQENPHGQIIEVLGPADDPEMEMQLILRKYALSRSFPPDIEAAAETIPRQVRPHELKGREDFRQLITFTIDGETARDFDDAVSLEFLPNGHVLLGVHIADVSHYVREGSPIDQEAYERGTSVYFPGQVIPMLPPRLSNEVCCLQPEVDRLTLSVLMELTAAAEMVRYDIVDSVIHSQARLTYSRVAEYFEGNPRALDNWNPAIGDVLDRMQELANQLRHKRLSAGSIDFDLPESDLVLDNEGKIDNILRAERNQAHMLIEEFMLLANRTVATHLSALEVPALYRVHDPPNPDKLVQFNTFGRAFGYAIDLQTPIHPRAVQTVLEEAQGKPEEQLINHILLRSMQRARYAAENTGHFGLAFTHYTHFTSPIRRYPDLLVHRLLRDTAHAKSLTAKRRAFWASRLPDVADHTSARERLADDAEREAIEVKKFEFMLDKVGQEYNGVVSGVTHFGLFVELENLFVEGLVHITWLPDYFVYHEDRFCLVGQHTGQTYRLGDRLLVRVDNVSIPRRQIDFSLLAKL
jgi:ribonuclease R